MVFKNIITRYDIFDRNDEDGERQVIRLFNKRKLVTELDLDDVSREDWEDELTSKLPLSADHVMDFLSSEEGEEDDEDEGGSIVPDKYRILYGAAQNCGDEIAITLTAFVTLNRASKKNPDGGLDRAKLRAVAEVNGIGTKLASWEDRGLNGGLLRMNTSNVLRGMWRRGERVEIDTMVWEAREVEKKPRKSSKKG